MFFKSTYQGLGINFGNQEAEIDISEEEWKKVKGFIKKLPPLESLKSNFIVAIKRGAVIGFFRIQDKKIIFSEDVNGIIHIISMKRRFRPSISNKIYYLSIKRA